MLVKELKEQIQNKSKEELIKVLVEVYKIIPKRIKEDYNIDKLILEGSNNKKEEKTDIIALEKEIKYFIECAMQQFYFIPNRIIPKTERPKWRFKIKRYINDLKKINDVRANNLLVDLYNLLSYGCHYYIFSTDDPFRSVGIVQVDFLEYIIESILKQGVQRENLKKCIDIVINSEIDTNTIHSQLIDIFIVNLKLSESMELVIELLKEEYLRLEKLKSKEDFYTIEKINNIVESVCKLYIKLCDFDLGIKYFLKHYIKRDKEITYYCLLNILKDYDLKDKWIEVYEKASDKIELRNSLEEEYKYLKKHNDFI